jgi:choline dehydrogenase
VPAIYQVLLATSGGKRNGPRDFIVSVRDALNPDGTKKYPLDVKLDTHVTRVTFDTTSNPPKATGVEYLEGKYLYRASKRTGSAGPGIPGSVTASREVIVSGGAYNSPQILKLSGVGPAEELKKFGIPVIKDLPGVGTNLQDHYEISVLADTPNNFSALNGCTFGQGGSDPCLDQWRVSPRVGSIYGAAYDSAGFGAAVYYKSTVAANDDFDIMALGGPATFRGYFPNYSVDATTGHNHWSWVVLKAHPRSRAGSVTLRSPDPLDVPYIDFEYFEEGGDEDLQAMYEGIQFARDSYARQPVPCTETLPGPDMQTYVV